LLHNCDDQGTVNISIVGSPGYTCVHVASLVWTPRAYNFSVMCRRP